MSNNAHLFALHAPDISNHIAQSGTITIKDRDLWHRIVTVLRLKEKESVVLFNQQHHGVFYIDQKTYDRSGVLVGNITSVQTHAPLQPSITLFVGLTKKEAFQDIAYSAAQLGVSEMYPVLCAKTSRAWGGEKELERLQKIMIAGCEQSKNFTLPQIFSPIILAVLPSLTTSNDYGQKIIFSPDGMPLTKAMHHITLNPTKKLAILVGPEGGFTQQEEADIAKLCFEPYALTPTILRTQEAVLVGIGALRSAPTS